MTDTSRMTDYINSLQKSRSPLLERIARQAREDRVPIIREETAALLETLVCLKAPSAILEVGTAVGYSALLMAAVMPADCHITTIEKYEKRIPLARRHFEEAGESGRITLKCGDADQILKELSGPYDLIFMDAAKGQYINWLPDVMGLMKPGSVLVSDNILQDGDIIESRYAVERRDRTIHCRMREYLFELKHRDGLVSSIVPIGDGVAVSVFTGHVTADREETDR